MPRNFHYWETNKFRCPTPQIKVIRDALESRWKQETFRYSPATMFLHYPWSGEFHRGLVWGWHRFRQRSYRRKQLMPGHSDESILSYEAARSRRDPSFRREMSRNIRKEYRN